MKKQCNPTKAKSFKERNPDLDLDEIQQNPNVPDDVKAMLKESVLTLHEEDTDFSPEDAMSLQSPADFKTKQELLEYIDDGTGETDNKKVLFTYFYQLGFFLLISFKMMMRKRTLSVASISVNMMQIMMMIG